MVVSSLSSFIAFLPKQRDVVLWLFFLDLCMWANYSLCLAVRNPEISLLWQGWAISNSLVLQSMASTVLILRNSNSAWQFGFDSVYYEATLTLMSGYVYILCIKGWSFPVYNPTFLKDTLFQWFPFWGSMSQFTDGRIRCGDVDLKSCPGMNLAVVLGQATVSRHRLTPPPEHENCFGLWQVKQSLCAGFWFLTCHSKHSNHGMITEDEKEELTVAQRAFMRLNSEWLCMIKYFWNNLHFCVIFQLCPKVVHSKIDIDIVKIVQKPIIQKLSLWQ